MSNTPLAERLRPKTLAEYIGQDHLIGPNGVLQSFIDNKYLPSIILWGPPGIGKTSLSRLLAEAVGYNFIELSAIHSGVKDVREAIQKSEKQSLFDARPSLLFIDEIHRFSKSQQDSLLAAVEKGSVSLIGATTENPSFEVISPLLSRCQVYTLKSFSREHLDVLMQRALTQDLKLKSKALTIEESEKLMQFANGDARKLLNTLELIAESMPYKGKINNAEVEKRIKESPLRFDKAGEEHYNLASALIKSIRGSDPNAAVYYLARLIECGESPKFIVRRLIISASEDIGMANPNALLMAVNAAKAVDYIGWPEGRIILSQCVVYLASSPKSNSSYMAINHAQKTVRETGNLSIPLSLRNAPTSLMKDLGYGQAYQYSHDFPQNFVEQEFLPEEIKNSNFVRFADNAAENKMQQHLKSLWKTKYEW
jgi:putative ATPase